MFYLFQALLFILMFVGSLALKPNGLIEFIWMLFTAVFVSFLSAVHLDMYIDAIIKGLRNDPPKQ